MSVNYIISIYIISVCLPKLGGVGVIPIMSVYIFYNYPNFNFVRICTLNLIDLKFLKLFCTNLFK